MNKFKRNLKTYKHAYIPIAVIIILLGGVVSISAYNSSNRTNENIISPGYDRQKKTALPAHNKNNSEKDAWYELDAKTFSSPSAEPKKRAKADTSDSLSIRFVDLPKQIRANEPFTVTWKIDGPAGAKGDDTTIEMDYKVSSVANNARSSSSTQSSQSFGSFVLPQTFDTNFSLGSSPGTINLRITATVNGQTLSAQDSVQLIN